MPTARGGRIAIAIYSALFFISAVYFVLLMAVFMPMLVISYPYFASTTVEAITTSVIRGDIINALLRVLQFLFLTLPLVALVGMLWPLLRMALRRGPRPSGRGGMAWRDRG